MLRPIFAPVDGSFIDPGGATFATGPRNSLDFQYLEYGEAEGGFKRKMMN